MKFPKDRLAPILDGAIRDWHHPLVDGQPAPAGVHRIHRHAGRTVAHIRILRAALIQFDDLDDTDARLAGYPSIGDYLHAWTNLHNAAWTGQTAWHITFQLEPPRERPLFLARRKNPAVGDDYTTSSQRSIDDCEAVHPAEVELLTTAAHKRWNEHRANQAAAHATLPLHVRLAMAQRDAKEHHVNVSQEMRVIERSLQRLEQKTRRAA